MTGVTKDGVFLDGSPDCNELLPAVHGYLCSIARADTLIGGLADSLDESSYADNTTILFWSGHGYHYGEKQRMAKRWLWERFTHVPCIVVVPGVRKPGRRCTLPVDLMSVCPTLSELCGIPVRKENEGVSIVPLLTSSANTAVRRVQS